MRLAPGPRPERACMSAFELEIEGGLGDVPERDAERGGALYFNSDNVVRDPGQKSTELASRGFAQRPEGLQLDLLSFRLPEMVGLLERPFEARAGYLKVVLVRDHILNVQQRIYRA